MVLYIPKRAGGVNLQAFVLVAGLFLSTAVLATFFFFHNRQLGEQQLRETMETHAAMAALRIDAEDVKQVQSEADMQSAPFLRMEKNLYELLQALPNARFVYIMRRTDDPNMLAFVGDSDLYLYPEGFDENENGVIDPSEEPSTPGLMYDISEIPALQGPAFIGPTSDAEFTVDQWGEFISAYAPIRDEKGKVVGIIGIDVDAREFLSMSQSLFRPTVFVLVILWALFVATYLSVLMWRRRLDFVRELEEERSALINLALHQLGAPVAIFRWWLEILKDREEMKSDEKGREICAEMDEGVTRMSQIILALRDISAFESAAYKRVKDPSYIADTVRDIQDEYAQRLKLQEKTLECHIPHDLKPVFIDRKLLAAVMRELVSNAVDYSPHNTTITIHAENQMNGVLVEVRDHGCGIPQQDLPRIFRKFSRGSNASKYKPSGNGIGLFFAKKAIDRAGGKIWVQSELGKGTCFSFILPTK